MGKNRSEKMENRRGFAGLVDHLRYHEASRQGFGFLLVLVCAIFVVPGDSRIIAGFAVAVIGQGWRSYAAGVIHKNRRLATTGAYSLVRHPLYLGNFLILTGFTLASGNLLVALIVFFFYLFYYPAAIRYEDAKLENIFGDEWRAWSGSIPAMFPSKLIWQTNTAAEWNLRQSLIHNGELIYTIYMTACAAWLWHRGMV